MNFASLGQPHLAYCMNFKAWILPLAVALLASTSGCSTGDTIFLTPRLWGPGMVRNFHEPSDQPGLKVFRSSKPADYLVLYEEMWENGGRIRRRAFYLNANLERLHSRRKPRFVNPAKAESLELVPVLLEFATASTNAAASVSLSPDGTFWRLHEADGEVVDFNLPTYPTAGSTVLRVALTPLAVSGDAIIVGTFVGLLVAISYANGQCH